MRLASYSIQQGSSSVGIVSDDGSRVLDLSRVLSPLGVRGMEDVVDLDGAAWAALLDLAGDASTPDLPSHSIESVRLLPPVPRPVQMPFVRANYPDLQGVRPDLERPAFFSKLPSALIGEGDTILLPPDATQPDWEGELALVIGRRASHVPRDEAFDYVAGYTITNDITARDIQASGEPALAKNYRTFAPVGPWLVTADEIADPHDLSIKQWVNGELFQDGNTRDMVFDIPEIIAFLSSVTDLYPGDIVATGAPAGVGKHQSPPVFLEDGDVLRVEVAGIGALNNPVAAAPG